MRKTLFQSFLLSALILLNAPAYAYQYVEWSSLPSSRVLEWCSTNGEADTDLPTDEYSSLMEQAEALAADDEAVAVGKLREAIEWAKNNNDESRLQAAIDQFLADNADLEKDETAKVGTTLADWNVGSGNNSQKATYSHNGITLIEHFGETRVGIMLSQEVSVENGTYNIELYATSHNAWNGQYMPVSADNPAPSLQSDANDVAYVFGSSLGVTEKTWITARRNSGMSSFEPETYAINGVQVFDEKLLMGLAIAKAGQTEWHTIQIKSLKWITTAKQAYAAVKSQLSELVAEGLILYRDDSKTNGRAEFREVLEVGEYAMSFSNMYNIPELEAIVAELRDAIAEFRKANYYIDFAPGEYYILDGESRLMMAAGNEWGTHGIVNEQGLDLILTPNTTNRSVSINSRVTNGGYQQYLGSNLYMDSDEYGWFFDKQGSGFYIANSEGQYLNIDSNHNLVLGNTPHEWIIVPKDELMQERMKALESATQNNPVDATFLLQNPTFNRNDMRTEAWEVGGNCTDKTLGGPLYENVENYCAESYHSTFTISQTISDAPAGIYQLTVQGFYRQEDGVTEDAPKFFIGSETAELPVIAGSENSMADAGASFYAGLYTIEPITFVYDGNGGLTVGIVGTAVHQWVTFDNYQLSYLGEAETPIEHDYVDLGLPSGTLWATYNVGANSPEEYGDYFAWGETEPKEDFSWETYKYCEGTANTLTKYCKSQSDYGYNGFTDDLTELLPEDDAATVNWGDEWQMPSEGQIEELINSSYTTTEWTTVNGVNGRKITSIINGNSIFLPAAGCKYNMSPYRAGAYGFYLSRSLSVVYGVSSLNSHRSPYLYFDSDNIIVPHLDRCQGKTVRPVRKKEVEHEYIDLGLPSGTLWATCNVGANSPEEYGDYFAWGETEPKEDYNDWTSYRISDYILAKYNVDGGTGILTSLQPEDDAATVNWGSDWQMPSDFQIDELMNYTVMEWTQLNGVNGRLFTSTRNGNSIFLPAAGYYYYDGKSEEGEAGNYWLRLMRGIRFTSSDFYLYGNHDMCFTVRPVRYTEPVLVSSIVLSDTLLNMEVGTFRLLSATTIEPYNADNRYEVWKSSDPNIATISYGKVRAHSVGTCTITCYASDGSDVKAECQVTVFEPEEHDYVDLGLPSGTLWATCNVGAENPEDYGDYFAWGETTTKDIYEGNYKSYDEKELDVIHDAATSNWGSSWQMPSIDQIEELINSNYTSTEWTIVNGVNGRKITSNINGNSIFLPAANTESNDEGRYYSRSKSEILPGYAVGLCFKSDEIYKTNFYCTQSLTVRPVRKKEVYAELAEETGTMTYYYDYLRTSRSGLTEIYDPVNRVNRPSNKYGSQVLKTVIDPSMKEAKMTSMSYMFDRCEMMTSIEGLENLNTDYVTDMSYLFWKCSKLESLDLSSFNTSNVERMNDMFWDCRSLQIIDLTSFDITNVKDMSYMFHSCSELTTICCFGDWSTSNANSSAMFQGCDKLVGGKGTPYNDAFMDKTYARPDGGTGSPGYFTADTMTGIKAIENRQQQADNRIYNLVGQQIMNGKWSNGKLPKGINIVGGRKVLK